MSAISRTQLDPAIGPSGAGASAHIGEVLTIHPHMFRRTVATEINEQASVYADELLGHTDPKVTIEHFFRRNEHMNPADGGTARRRPRPGNWSEESRQAIGRMLALHQ
ncbi:MAG: hypothetical protein ACR2KG_11150 [Nocardioidaceae bacterium]